MLTMTRVLRALGHCDKALRKLAARTGALYALHFARHYNDYYKAEYFAGNLDDLVERYRTADADARSSLDVTFDRIADGLVMPNGVRKTTYINRLSQTITDVLSNVSLPRREIRILDVPSSTGAATIHNINLIKERYSVQSYILGDLYHKILYDPRRGCVFDEAGNLLQVAFKRWYFGINKAHKSGDQYTLLSAMMLMPHSVAAWLLVRLYRFQPDQRYKELLLIHPRVELLLHDGICRLEVVDVFKPIPGSYDLILSFNLLQRNYFSSDVIASGVANLTEALADGGLLVTGNTESFWAVQKDGSSLVTRLRKGTF